jgi:hypothetical protein
MNAQKTKARTNIGDKPFPELSRSKAHVTANRIEYPAKVICFRRKPVNVYSLADCPSHFDISSLLLQGDQLRDVSNSFNADAACCVKFCDLVDPIPIKGDI